MNPCSIGRQPTVQNHDWNKGASKCHDNHPRAELRSHMQSERWGHVYALETATDCAAFNSDRIGAGRSCTSHRPEPHAQAGKNRARVRSASQQPTRCQPTGPVPPACDARSSPNLLTYILSRLCALPRSSLHPFRTNRIQFCVWTATTNGATHEGFG